MADASCTTCHADIEAHREVPSLRPQSIQNVSRFDAEHHPGFRSIATDPRTLKFTAAAHHLHLTPGLAADAKHQPVMTVGMLSAADKTRYALPGQKDADLVQLSCGSCHQLSGTVLGAGTGRLRWPVLPSAPVPPSESAAPSASVKSTGGAYMQPVVFENQCSACHRLTINPGQDFKSDMKVAGDVVAHRLQPAQLATEVRRYWGDRYLHDHPAQLARNLPLPSHPRELENRDAREWIRDNATGSLNHLRTVCSECHELGGVAAEKLSLDGEAPGILPPPVLPVQVPHPWLEHAKFDHSAHRSVNCRDCHAGAYPSDAGVQAGPSTSAPMIPGRETCVRCHGPRDESSAPPRGGARFDCVECHRFHNRDEP
jgi:mono/diheme cytochrome c family protein